MPRFSLCLPASELDLPLCVSSGQVFRWERLEDGSWLGVDGKAWFLARMEFAIDGRPDANLEYLVESNVPKAAFERLFRLETRLGAVESEIAALAPELAPYVSNLPGLRVLRPTNPEEVLFCFLCTPNNNLERITRMVRSLAEYGEPFGEAAARLIRRFPSAERIAAIPEGELRSKGFGYRGRSIPSVARQLGMRPDGWLAQLKSVPYEEAHAELRALDGVGPKLADCICLFGLHHLQAVPVDTHLWQAAVRLYFPEYQGKSLTGSRYQAIGEHFRGRFGALAGWAHQYLFYESLMRRRGTPRA